MDETKEITTAKEAILSEMEEVVALGEALEAYNDDVAAKTPYPEEEETEIKMEESEEEIVKDIKLDKQVNELQSKIESGLAEQNLLIADQDRFATKKQIKELYSASEVVYTSTGNAPIVSEEQIVRSESFNNLMRSMKQKAPLTGRLTGSEYISYYNTAEDGSRIETKIPCGTMQYGTFKIIIPYNEMIKVPEELSGSPLQQRNYIKLLVDKELGAETSFVVTKIDEVEGMAIASRFEAMKILRRIGFQKKNKITDKYNINEGSLVEARVMYVTSAGIGVEVSGYDVFIPTKELDYAMVPSVEALYRAGDKVIVRITKLQREKKIDDNGIKKTRLGLTASVRAAKPDPRPTLISKYQEGSKAYGVVANVNRNGIFVRLGDRISGQIDCLCGYPATRTCPALGDSVIIQIIMVDKANFRLRGRIVR